MYKRIEWSDLWIQSLFIFTRSCIYDHHVLRLAFSLLYIFVPTNSYQIVVIPQTQIVWPPPPKHYHKLNPTIHKHTIPKPPHPDSPPTPHTPTTVITNRLIMTFLLMIDLVEWKIIKWKRIEIKHLN